MAQYAGPGETKGEMVETHIIRRTYYDGVSGFPVAIAWTGGHLLRLTLAECEEIEGILSQIRSGESLPIGCEHDWVPEFAVGNPDPVAHHCRRCAAYRVSSTRAHNALNGNLKSDLGDG